MFVYIRWVILVITFVEIINSHNFNKTLFCHIDIIHKVGVQVEMQYAMYSTCVVYLKVLSNALQIIISLSSEMIN